MLAPAVPLLCHHATRDATLSSLAPALVVHLTQRADHIRLPAAHHLLGVLEALLVVLHLLHGLCAHVCVCVYVCVCVCVLNAAVLCSVHHKNWQAPLCAPCLCVSTFSIISCTVVTSSLLCAPRTCVRFRTITSLCSLRASATCSMAAARYTARISATSRAMAMPVRGT